MNLEFINFSKPETGNFLVDIIFWLVQISTSVTLGVILFTVLLKLITLPFDFFSRASMRKNSLKMEQMRPELEKLQKQYADNKDLYNQKMMALYKKNGYSMFGSCLPTILTLVIFIVAINAFTNYSKFQNRQYFYNMSQSYNNVVYAGMELDDKYVTRDEDGVLIIDVEELKKVYDSGETVINKDTHDIVLLEETDGTTKYFTVSTTNSYVKYKRFINENGSLGANFTYELIAEKLVGEKALKSEENNNLTIKVYDENGKEKVLDFTKAKENDKDMTAEKFLTDIRQEKSAERYRAENQEFLWVKNIWVTDSPMAHPVESSWETFKNTHGYPSDGEDIKDAGYNELIAKLEFEKNAPNGFFILVVLTAGMSFLMQVVMGKSQKAQMELQTVDGQGAQTQKMMKWMMPIMMAFFSFMYTAAFSLYIIISNVLSIGTTYGINFIVDRRFKKKEGLDTEKTVIRGRVYTPKEEEKQEPKKEKKSKLNKKEEPKGDFLSGTADAKKHVRGRIK
ncbi:MAG: YidC/Oxa1 family membrane protein insertase [Clostridia bacterium]|nr:YidC/Oxa1 family membrane protein insertase [Clostridia bacterium]